MSEIEVVVQPTIVEVTAGQFVPVPGPVGPEGPPGVGGEDVTARLDGIDAALAAEATERTSADGALSGRIGALETAVPGKADTAAVAAIDTRLAAAEATLGAVADDIDLLEAADTDIATTVDALDTRVAAVEAALPGLATDAEVADAVAAEASARASADNALDTRLSAAESALLDAVLDTDPRLSDARTPTAHAASHAIGGDDALTPADIGAAAVGHTHSIAEVTGLQTALDGKADAGASGLPAGGSDTDVLSRSGGSAIWETIVSLAGRVISALNGNAALVSTGQAFVRVAAAASNSARVVMGTIDATAGVLFRQGDGTAAAQDRWLASKTSEAETGSDAGSNFQIARYSDTGTLLGTVFRMVRATGQIILNGLEVFIQTGDLRLAVGTITVSVGNMILTAGRLEFGTGTAEIRYNDPSFSSYLDIRAGTGNRGLRTFPHGVRPRSTTQGDYWFYDEGALSSFQTGASVSLTPTVLGSIWLALSGTGGSSSIAINNPANAPLNGNANSGRFVVRIENRGSGNAATPTFGSQWEARAWGAALAPNTFREAEFRYVNTSVGTRRYFQITDWQTFTP